MLQRSVSEIRRSRSGRPSVSRAAPIHGQLSPAPTDIRSLARMPSALLEIDRARELVLESARPLERGVGGARRRARPRAVARAEERRAGSRRSTAPRWTASRSAAATSGRPGRTRPWRSSWWASRAPGTRWASRSDRARPRPSRRGRWSPTGPTRWCRSSASSAGDGHVHLREPVPAGQRHPPQRRGHPARHGRCSTPAGRWGRRRVGVAASLGQASLHCRRRPLVSVIATGDELLEPGAEPRPGAIYNSNGHAVPALARRAGALTTVPAGRGRRPRGHPRGDRRRARGQRRARPLRRGLGGRPRPRAPDARRSSAPRSASGGSR